MKAFSLFLWLKMTRDCTNILIISTWLSRRHGRTLLRRRDTDICAKGRTEVFMKRRSAPSFLPSRGLGRSVDIPQHRGPTQHVKPAVNAPSSDN